MFPSLYLECRGKSRQRSHVCPQSIFFCKRGSLWQEQTLQSLFYKQRNLGLSKTQKSDNPCIPWKERHKKKLMELSKDKGQGCKWPLQMLWICGENSRISETSLHQALQNSNSFSVTADIELTRPTFWFGVGFLEDARILWNLDNAYNFHGKCKNLIIQKSCHPHTEQLSMIENSVTLRWVLFFSRVFKQICFKITHSTPGNMKLTRTQKKNWIERKSLKRVRFLAIEWKQNDGLAQREIHHLGAAFFFFPKTELLKANCVNLHGCFVCIAFHE